MTNIRFLMDNYLAAVKELDIAVISECMETSLENGDDNFKITIAKKYFEDGYNRGLLTEEEFKTSIDKLEATYK